jgi:hypothetical protein
MTSGIVWSTFIQPIKDDLRRELLSALSGDRPFVLVKIEEATAVGASARAAMG